MKVYYKRHYGRMKDTVAALTLPLLLYNDPTVPTVRTKGLLTIAISPFPSF
jgi:hypothetical protein